MWLLSNSFRRQISNTFNSFKNRIAIVEYSNLVSNGDLSNGTTGWILSSGSGSTIEIDEIIFLYSGKSVKFINSSLIFNVLYQTVGSQSGKWFFSTYAKGDGITGTVSNRIRLGGSNVASLSLDTGTYDWKRFSFIFNVAEFDGVYLGSTSNFQGTLWQDGIILIKMDDTRYENYTLAQMNDSFKFTPTTGLANIFQS